MSTSATIEIDYNDRTYNLYKRYDAYPAVVVPELLDRLKKAKNLKSFISDLALEDDSEYLFKGVYDMEQDYVYKVDFALKQITYCEAGSGQDAFLENVQEVVTPETEAAWKRRIAE